VLVAAGAPPKRPPLAATGVDTCGVAVSTPVALGELEAPPKSPPRVKIRVRVRVRVRIRVRVRLKVSSTKMTSKSG